MKLALPASALTVTILASFLISWHDVKQFHGIDLRPRVVSTRAFFAGLEAYEVPWQPGGGDRLLDPMRRHPGPGRSLNAPTLFLVYGPTAWLPYVTQRWIWFALDWLLFVATAVLLWRTVAQQHRPYLIGILLVSFLAGHSWRLHVERGQYYSLVMFLMALAAYHAHRGAETKSGLALGIATGLRPSFVIGAAVLWLLGRRRSAVTTGITALLLGLATLPIGGVAAWRSAARTIDDFVITTVDSSAVGWRYGAAVTTPLEAEGVNLVSNLDTTEVEPTFFYLAQTIRPHVAPSHWPVLIRWTTMLASVLLLIWVQRGARSTAWRGSALLVAYVVILDAELFLPSKCAYTELLLLPPLALALANAPARSRHLYAILALGLAFLGIGWIAYAGELSIARAVVSLALLNVLLWRMASPEPVTA